MQLNPMESNDTANNVQNYVYLSKSSLILIPKELFDLIFTKMCSNGGDFPKNHRDSLVVSFAIFQTRVIRFGPRWVRLTQNVQIRNFFRS